MPRRFSAKTVSTDAYLCMKFLLGYQKKNRLSPDRYQPERIPRLLLGYKECKSRAGTKGTFRKLGGPLGEVAHFCLNNELPPLNALVVVKARGKPGYAYLGTDQGAEWKRDAYAVLSFEYPANLLSYVVDGGY